MSLSSSGSLVSSGFLVFLLISEAGMFIAPVYAEESIQFNTDVLDLMDRTNIDLSQFSRGGYIMPGTYDMKVHVNKKDLPEEQIAYYAPDDDENGSQACISHDLMNRLGFRDAEAEKLAWWHGGECLDVRSVPGMESRGDLATSSLYLSIPQAFIEYTDDNWDPPSRWDEGISGLLLDYNISARSQRQLQRRSHNNYNSLGGNGTAGLNLGAWRLRADWQAELDHQTGSNVSGRKQLDWNRYYLFRAVPALRSRLTLGEIYLDSGMFDSFRFTGVGLISDDSMLPPNLRGYAPEVTGVAKTNARVIISQQGRVLYETTVATGPFRIQDISDAVSGELNVRVEEQDGGVQEFAVNTSSIPYLTRPGSVRFKFSAGQPSDWHHHSQGPLFTSGELSWGVSNGWSVYGGALAGGDYKALSVGIGRDLMMLGALSFDATESWARLPRSAAGSRTGENLSGGSYRLSYSKNFDEYNSQVTFAGYRFSEKDFMSMSQYLDARNYSYQSSNGKEMYTITFNKQFPDVRLSTYLNYSHETFWNRPANDRYNLTLSQSFDIGRFRNLSLSLSAYRNVFSSKKEDGGYISLSMPWGNDSSVSYNSAISPGDTRHNLSYYRRVNERDNYKISAGTSRSGGSTSGYFTHEGDIASTSINGSYQSGRYSALGLSAQGGMTLTSEGGALHRSSRTGGTRLLVDTAGVANVPVRGYGRVSRTNSWGKAVIGDVNSYYRNNASIDLNKLSDEAEATSSVVQATLTEGAIGYRRFDVIAGKKAMAVIKLADGSEPPFGATVQNSRRQETGIVNDAGNVYLVGIKPAETMTVRWNGEAQCQVRMPASLPAEMLLNTLLLPCHTLSSEEKASGKSG
ncbi:TPA: outer membrane usher protein [Enterobacter kobei]|nr:outer membrane usher protein [Enterobacter kobei]